MTYSRSEQVLNRYITALQNLKELCDAEVPVRKSAFCQEHNIYSVAISFLVTMKVIRAVVEGTAKEGTIYEWVYKQPSNETTGALANRLLTVIYDYQGACKKKTRVAHTVVNTPVQAKITSPAKTDIPVIKAMDIVYTDTRTKIEAIRKRRATIEQELSKICVEENNLSALLQAFENIGTGVAEA